MIYSQPYQDALCDWIHCLFFVAAESELLLRCQAICIVQIMVCFWGQKLDIIEFVLILNRN